MEAAQDRDRGDATDRMNRAAHRCVLAQREMCANAVVIASISGQDSAQMGLVEYNDVVEALTPDRTDETLDIAVLPRRARRNGSVSDPHRPKSLRDDGAAVAFLVSHAARWITGDTLRVDGGLKL